MLDFQPMTATEHRNRWAAATARVWDFTNLEGIAELPLDADRPGVHPEHIFDFHDGLRLIVSVDRYGDDGDYLHVSASARPDSTLWRKIKNGLPLKQLGDLVKERVRFLSGREVTLGYVTFPGKGVPHYFDPPLENP
jgi:hypothetical protein